MTKRKRCFADYKAKVAPDALCEANTLADLSKQYGVYPKAFREVQFKHETL